jgi:LacI family transcriptional regulator/LacI family repressor for deo operon, udp, cdd, tsx, nupC, and nupG
MSVRQVAEQAGVSPATVSRVFTQPDTVAAETRRRVLAVAEKLQYTPHPVARSLARGRTGNLGIVVNDIANSFAAVIIKAVQEEARHHGCALFVAGAERDGADEFPTARALAAQVDGLILVSPGMSESEVRSIAAIAPIVLVNYDIVGVPAVLIPAEEGAAQAVEHLHALGHRTIAYISGPPIYSNRTRLHTFRGACTRLSVNGLEIDVGDARFSAGVRGADLVLATPATGVLAFNDEVAVGVVNRLTDRGVRVPDEVSVVGFDDTGLAQMVRPRLTTVRLPAAVAGRSATRILLERLAAAASDGPEPLRLASELIVRNSTGPAPKNARPDHS